MRPRLVAAAAVAAVAALALGAGAAQGLDPGTFAAVSSGVVLVRANCVGGPQEGTGFLIGTRIVMTARHVVKGCSRTRVHTTSGVWVPVADIQPWEEADNSDVDIATLRLARDVDGHVFSFRTGQIPVGANVAAIGHPLGADLAMTQGKVVDRYKRQIFVRLLGGEGASGAPVVDGAGRVVAILQKGYGGQDALGQQTSGLVSGYDFSSRWVGWRTALCKLYPTGGLTGCK